MKTTVVKRITVDAAHFLPNYDGPCKNLHGHRWLIELGVRGDPNPSTGMVVDFTNLNCFLKGGIHATLDHSLVNDTISNPTAENIVHWILKQVRYHRKEVLGSSENTLALIRVWETENSYAEISGTNLLAELKE